MGLFSWIKNLFSDDEKEAEKNVEKGVDIQAPSLDLPSKSKGENLFQSTNWLKKPQAMDSFDKFDTFQDGRIDTDIFTPRTIGNPVYEAKKKAGLLITQKSDDQIERFIRDRQIKDIERFSSSEDDTDLDLVRSFKKGVQVYLPQTKQTLSGLRVLSSNLIEPVGRMLEDKIGENILSDKINAFSQYNLNKGLQGFNKAKKEQEELLKGQDTSLEDIKGVKSFLNYLAYNTGSVLTSIAETGVVSLTGAAVGSEAGPVGTATGGVTGVVAKSGVKKFLFNKVEKVIASGILEKELAEGVLEKETKKFIAKGLMKEAAIKEAKFSLASKIVDKEIGSGVALFSSSYLRGLSETTTEGMDEEGKVNAASNVLFSLPYAAVDAIVDLSVLGKIKKGSEGEKAIRRYTKAIVGTGGKEVISEDFQEGTILLSGLANGKEYTSEEVISRLANSTAGAFFGSVPFGVISGRQDRSILETKEIKDTITNSTIEDKETVVHTQDTENGNEVTIKEVKPEVFQQEDKLSPSFVNTKVDDIAFKLADLVSEQEAANFAEEFKSKEYKDYKDFVKKLTDGGTKLLEKALQNKEQESKTYTSENYLINEARKYKSADEFIKSQTKSDKQIEDRLTELEDILSEKTDSVLDREYGELENELYNRQKERVLFADEKNVIKELDNLSKSQIEFFDKSEISAAKAVFKRYNTPNNNLSVEEATRDLIRSIKTGRAKHNLEETIMFRDSLKFLVKNGYSIEELKEKSVDFFVKRNFISVEDANKIVNNTFNLLKEKPKSDIKKYQLTDIWNKANLEEKKSSQNKEQLNKIVSLFVGEPDKVIVTEVKPIPDYIVDTKITEELLHSEKDNVPEIVNKRFTDPKKTQIAETIAQQISTQVKPPRSFEMPKKHIDIAEKESNYDKIGANKVEIPKYLKVEKTKETPKYMALAMEAYDKLSIDLPETSDIDIENLATNKVKQDLAREVNSELSKEQEKLMNYEIGKIKSKISDISNSMAVTLGEKYQIIKGTQLKVESFKGEEGWLSNAPEWLSKFYTKNNRFLNDSELKEQAEKLLVEDSRLFDNGENTDRIILGEEYISLKNSKKLFEGILSSYEAATEKQDNRVVKYIKLNNALTEINKAEAIARDNIRENKRISLIDAKIAEAKQLQPKEYASAFENISKEEKQLFRTDLEKFVDEFKDPYVIKKANGEFKFVDGNKVDNLSTGEKIKFRLADKADELGVKIKDYFVSIINEHNNIKNLSNVRKQVYNSFINSDENFQELLRRKQSIVNRMEIIKDSYKDQNSLIQAISLMQRKQMRDLVKEKVKIEERKRLEKMKQYFRGKIESKQEKIREQREKFKGNIKELKQSFRDKEREQREQRLEKEAEQRIRVRFRDAVFANYKKNFPSIRGAIDQFKSRWAKTLYTMPSEKFEQLMSAKFDPYIDHELKMAKLFEAINIRKRNLQIKNIKDFESLTLGFTIPDEEKINSNHIGYTEEELQKYLDVMNYMQKDSEFASVKVLKAQGVSEFFNRPTAENKAEFNNQFEKAIQEGSKIELFDNRGTGKKSIKEIKIKEDLPDLESELYREPYIQVTKGEQKRNYFYPKGEVFNPEEFSSKIITRDKFVEFLAKDFNVPKSQAEAIYKDFGKGGLNFFSKGLKSISIGLDRILGNEQFGETNRVNLLLAEKLIMLKQRLENSDIKIKREWEEKFKEAKETRKKSEFKDNEDDTSEILIKYAESKNDVSVLSSATETEKKLAIEIQDRMTIEDNNNYVTNKDYKSRRGYFPVIAKRLGEYMKDGKNVFSSWKKYNKQRNLIDDIQESNRIAQEDLNFYKGLSSESIFQHAKQRTGVIEGSRDAEYVYTKYFQEAARARILNEALPEIVTLSEFLKQGFESKSNATKFEAALSERLGIAKGFTGKKGLASKLMEDTAAMTTYKFMGFEPDKQFINVIGEAGALFDASPIKFISALPSHLFWNARKVAEVFGVEFSTKQQKNIDKILRDNPAIAKESLWDELLTFKDFKLSNIISAGSKAADRQMSVLSFIMHLNDIELDTGIVSPERAAKIQQQIGTKMQRSISPARKSKTFISSATNAILFTLTGWRNFHYAHAVNTMRQSVNGMSDIFRKITGKERLHPEIQAKELAMRYASFVMAYGRMVAIYSFQKWLLETTVLSENEEDDKWWQKRLRQALRESNSRMGAFASLIFQISDVSKEISSLSGKKETPEMLKYIEEKKNKFEEIIYASGLRGIDNTENRTVLLDQFIWSKEWLQRAINIGTDFSTILGDNLTSDKEKAIVNIKKDALGLIPLTRTKDFLLEGTDFQKLQEQEKTDRKESKNLFGSPYGFSNEDEKKARDLYENVKNLDKPQRIALIKKLENSKDNDNNGLAKNLKTMFSNEAFSNKEKEMFFKLNAKQENGAYLTDKQKALGLYRYIKDKPVEEKKAFLQNIVDNKLYYGEINKKTLLSLIELNNIKPEFTEIDYKIMAKHKNDRGKEIGKYIKELRQSGASEEEIFKLISVYNTYGIIDRDILKDMILELNQN